MKERLIKKFIQAFNAGYPTILPCITLTDTDAAESMSQEIFTPLAATLAVLYYQQLVDYLDNYKRGGREKNYSLEIHRLLEKEEFNRTYFFLFDKHFWGGWPLVPQVDISVKARLEDIHDINYRLRLVEDDRHTLQAVLNQLFRVVYTLPPSILKEKTEALIDALQTEVDAYIAELVKSGNTIPITSKQHSEMEKVVGKELLEKVVNHIQRYQAEFFPKETTSLESTEQSLWTRLKGLLVQLLQGLRNFIKPHSTVSATFFFNPEQSAYKRTQDFIKTCETVVGEKHPSLNA
ncbi:MAG: hypothetical protein REH83_02385 [Rickettsiella sp.]|nr:hypothetical protein [Rickettsiella sp.]